MYRAVDGGHFEGLVEADGLRLPQTRRWYMNVDDRFLGEDVIESLATGGQ